MSLIRQWPRHLSTAVSVITDFPRSVILLIGIITLLCLKPIITLETDNSLEAWFPENSPALINYLARNNTFGDDLSVNIIYQHPDLFSSSQVEFIRTLTEELESLQRVTAAHSITTVQVNRVTPFGMARVNLFDQSAESTAQAQQFITEDPLYADRLLSMDGSATAIEIAFDNLDNTEKEELIYEIETLLATETYSNTGLHLVGGLPLVTEMNRISQQESGRFLLAAIVIIYVICCWALGSPLFALFPLLISLISIIWITALFALSGNSINMITGIIPLVTLVLTIAVSIHILHRYSLAREEGLNRTQSIESAISQMFVPCLFSTLTTALALFAFVTSTIPPLHNFGIYAAAGAMTSFVLSVVLLPALIEISPKSVTKGNSLGTQWLDRISGWFIQTVVKSKALVLIVCTGVLVASVAGISQINFVTDQINYLKRSNPIRVGTENLRQWFNGVYPLDLVLVSHEAGFFFQPDNIRQLQIIGDVINEDSIVRTVVSPATLFRSLSRIGGTELETNDWEDFLENSNLERFFANLREQGVRYVSDDGTNALISIRSDWLDDEQAEELQERLSNSLSRISGISQLSWYFTGFSQMYVALNGEVARSQIASISFGFATIFLMLCLLFRSLRIGTIGMIPNIFPVVTTLGIIGWVGVDLDVATILIAAISLGIAVDDTIQFVYARRQDQQRRTETQSKPNLPRVYKKISRPIILTTLLLILGFVPMLGSAYLPMVYLGLFISLNVMFALIYDLVLLPILLDYADRSVRA